MYLSRYIHISVCSGIKESDQTWPMLIQHSPCWSSLAGTEIEPFHPDFLTFLFARHERVCWFFSVPFWQVASGRSLLVKALKASIMWQLLQACLSTWNVGPLAIWYSWMGKAPSLFLLTDAQWRGSFWALVYFSIEQENVICSAAAFDNALWSVLFTCFLYTRKRHSCTSILPI